MLLVSTLLLGHVAKACAADEDPSRLWIERPWEYRYIIQIESPYDHEGWKRVSAKGIVSGQTINHFRIDPLFPLSISIPTDPEQRGGENQAIGAIVVQFDKDGRVITSNDLSLNLRGRMNRPFEIVLSASDQPNSWQFHLGYWYTGSGNPNELEYTPAICEGAEIPYFQDKKGRYTKGFKSSSVSTSGNFGCREWGYYLQNDKFPYIDVTSYGKDQFGPFSYIRPILGWARFDAPPKPVIGKHGKVWVCLHECPNGESPGIIPDIKQWAAKNGWPVPTPPKKQPMFPDREYKRGAFVD